MLEALHKNLIKSCHIDDIQPIMVGVSGGPDSLCLLDSLHRLGYQVIVAHYNHQLRPEADADMEMARRDAQQIEAPFISGGSDVRQFAEDKGIPVEEAARTLRYQFLFGQARNFHARSVAVAHSADDQIETVLMHLIRGCGPSGLRGMSFYSLPNPWSQDIPLVRPLLNIWRTEIMAYLEERRLSAVYDSSNEDTRYMRNRLRHELIPQLITYNPGIKRNILRLAEIVTEEDEYIRGLVMAVWNDVINDIGDDFISIHRKEYNAQQPAIRRRLLREAINIMRPGLRDVDFEIIELADVAFQEAQSGSRWDLVGGLCLAFEQDYCWLVDAETTLPTSKWPQLADTTSLALELPGRLSLAAGWELVAEWETDGKDRLQAAQTYRDPNHAWLDADNIYGLTVRTRTPGEHFRPLGLNGHSLKLSDFMVNAKLSQYARDHWPLVCNGQEIAWIAGVRIAHTFRIREATRRVIHLQLIHC